MISYWEYRRLQGEINRRLISWAESGAFELAANEVLCLTPNLAWAQVHIDQILQNIMDKDGKKYRYIVFANNHDGDAQDHQDARQHAERIIKKARANEKVRKTDGLSILFLTNNRKPSSPYFWSANNTSMELPPFREWAFLPIPTDIVIYRETLTDLSNCSSARQTFAVMSVTPIEKKMLTTAVEHVVQRGLGKFNLRRLPRKAGFAYDIQLTDRSHYTPLVDWFKWEWDYRTPQIAGT